MEHIMALLLLSIISAYIGFGFNRMQDPDMIFEWYGNWLNYLAGFRFKTIGHRIFHFKLWWNYLRPNSRWFKFDFSKEISKDCTIRRKSKFLYYITKPLGRCIICNTTWIGMFLGFIFFRDLPLLFLNIFIVGVASAGIVVMIINRYHNLQDN
jgi:hypothetical protein